MMIRKNACMVAAMLLLCFVGHAQTDVQGNRVIVKNALFLKDWWITGIQRDTSAAGFGDAGKVPTAQAVKDYVSNNKIDTAVMLLPYARVQRLLDSVANLRVSIGTKTNTADTAAMLLPYARVQRLLDSVTNLKVSIGTKTNSADTAAMLLPYARAQRLLDSVANIKTSIGTKTNSADTAAMLLPYARVQRLLDSVTNIKTSIGTKQNVLTLSTTGTSGASTLVGSTLNIPQYSGSNIGNSDLTLTGPRTLTLGGNSFTLAGSSTSSRFHSDGNVTIGGISNSATYKLDVQGTLRSTGDFQFGSTAYAGNVVGMKMETSPTTGGSYFTLYGVGNQTTTGVTIRHRSDIANGLLVGSTTTGINIFGDGATPKIGFIGGSVNIQSSGTTHFIGYRPPISALNSAARSMGICTSFGDYQDLTTWLTANSIWLGGNGTVGQNVTTYYFGGGGDAALNTTAGRTVTFNATFPYTGLSNGVGGDFRIAGGRGTGTGLPGDVIFATATTTTTGSTLQTVTDRWYVKSGTGIFSNNNAPAASSVMDLTSTTKGFLPPRMTTTQRTAISSPDEGLTVYDLTLHKLYVWDGTVWQAAW